MRKSLVIIYFLFICIVPALSVEMSNCLSDQKYVQISNVDIRSNVNCGGQYGIMVTFDCDAIGYKGYPIYFYSYFLHGDDLSNVKKGGKSVYGFSITTAVYDKTTIRKISHFIPYKNLPSRYHGNLAVRIVVFDGFDNNVYTGRPIQIFYSTL